MSDDLITYQGSTDIFMDVWSGFATDSGKLLADSYLSDFDESILTEGERLNAILPLIKWCAEKNIMTEDLEDELYLYYESYLKGELDGVIADHEKDAVIHDLKETYKKVFGTEELVP